MDDLIKILGSFSIGGLTVGYCVAQIIKHPELVEKWQAIIYGWLSLVNAKYKYVAIKKDVQSKLNEYVLELSNELGVDNPKVRLKWTAQGEQEDIQIEDDSVVIVMRDRGYRNKNFVHAAYFYTSTTLLSHAKRHLSDKQGKSLDLYTTKKVIQSQNKSALELFMRDYFQPLLDDEKIRGFITQFVLIDRAGMYTHVLLQELSYLGSKSFLSKKDQAIIQEVNQLIAFLARRANREVGDTSIPEEFIGKYSRHSIKIVSTRQVREAGKFHLPAQRIVKAFQSGIENVYILGPHRDGGKKFIENACGHIMDQYEGIEIMKKAKFKNTTKKGDNERITDTYFVHMRNPSQAEYLIDDEMIGRLEELSGTNTEEAAA